MRRIRHGIQARKMSGGPIAPIFRIAHEQAARPRPALPRFQRLIGRNPFE